MKKLILFFGLILGTTLAHGAEQTMLARVTVYWRSEGQPIAACNGARLKHGNCAVDPKKISYGSKVIIANEELTAVDTGPAVVNRRAARMTGRTPEQRNALVIDRYFDTKSQALTWAESHPHFMTVRVVSGNSAPAPLASVAKPSIQVAQVASARQNTLIAFASETVATISGSLLAQSFPDRP